MVTLACNATAAGDGGGGGDAGDDGGSATACPYGPTNFGQEADDDDCKYHITWTSTPICEQPGSVMFTVVAAYKTGGPLKGAGTMTEVFTTTPGDQDAASYCDDESTHLSPNSGVTMTETQPGTYVGPVEFDQSGAWTIRFHFFGNCTDAPTAPHGHVAFHLTVP
jgi:hypothetical protein